MRKLFLVLTFGLSLNAQATHIVGGELEFAHVFGDQYRLSLIIYFDQLLGNPNALDQNVNISLFEKGNHTLLNVFNLPLVSNEEVSFTNPQCASKVNIRTRKLFYTRLITLNPQNFQSSAGYYFAFERCCRNSTINNITNPGDAGQTFYLEFAPLWQNGKHFINSSPRLFPPLSDFGCVGKPFYVDFGGVDDDGDSLVYSLAVPINGCSNRNNPAPQQASPANNCDGVPTPGGFYRRVNWAPGYSLSRMIHGNPDLAIDKDGLLTITPSQRGTFVFAVVCEEYRNGKRIGWMQREFQMTIVDGCIYDPPTARLKISDKPPRYYSPGDTIPIEAGKGAPTCFPVVVKDINGCDRFNYRIRTIYPKNNEVTVLGINSVRVTPKDSASIQVCFSDCPINQGLHRVDVLIGDNSCALPLYDTLKLLFNVKKPSDSPPKVRTSLPLSGGKCYDTLFVKADDLVSFDVEAKDSDAGRALALFAKGEGFELKDVGAVFPNLFGSDSLGAKFFWRPGCHLLDSLYTPKVFRFNFISSDTNICQIKNFDTACVLVHVSLPQKPNTTAVKTLTGSQVAFNVGLKRYETTVFIGQTLSFLGTIVDDDGDTVGMRAVGKGFSLADLGMTFPDAKGVGVASSFFNWRPQCTALDIRRGEYVRTFEVFFIGAEKGICKTPAVDTTLLVITLRFVPDPNSPPAVNLPRLVPVAPKTFALEAIVGDTVVLDVLGIDPDLDSMTLRMVGRGFDLSQLPVSLEPSNPISVAAGSPDLLGTFKLICTCGLLGTQAADRTYDFTFLLSDFNTCNLREVDSLKLLITIKDKPQIPFTPFPNAFSPNGDNQNQTYTIENLPIDNCKDQFKFFAVFNRWGERVYFSERRDFAWTGNDLPDGTYFYIVQFANSVYRGTISLLR